MAAETSLKRTLIICAVLILIGVLVVVLIFNTEPKAKREAASKRAPMLVEVIEADYGDFRPIISAMGEVRAAESLMLRPRVSGQVIKIADDFIPGAFVKKGQVLLQIDPADFENQLAMRKRDFIEAQTQYQLELGEQEIAQRDYRNLNKSLSDLQKSLVLREPQLAAAKASVDAAAAALRQAELELERTSVRAPFDAQVISRQVSTGTQVSSGDVLARLVGLDHYWVEASVASDKLRWLDRSGELQVTLRHRNAWATGQTRDGKLLSDLGALDQNTRLGRVLIEVEDPLAQNNSALPALAIGSYIESLIPARQLQNVVKLDRRFLRKDDTTWVMENDALSIRNLNIAYMDEGFAYISEGLAEGDLIITTSLSRIRDGAELRLKAGDDHE